MKSTLQRIEEIKRNGYKLDLGEVINDTFENYKKIALLGGAVLLLVGFVSIAIIGGTAALIFGFGEFTQSITDYNAGFVTSTALVLNLIASVIGGGLFAPITAGLIQMAHNASANEDFDFGTAFMHYSTEHFKELFFGAAIIALLGTGLTTAIELIKINATDGGLMIIGTVVTTLISGLVQIFTILMIPLIIFGKLKAVDAIKGSIVLVSKHFWVILLLAILAYVFVLLGLVAICIGIIFTIPVFFSMQYIIYTKAMPIVETNELDEIGKNFY
jgi:hypothetical protein